MGEQDLVVGNLVRALRLVLLAISMSLLTGFVLLQLADPVPLVTQAIAFALQAVVGVVAGIAVLRNRPIGRARWVLVAAVFAAAVLATTGIPADRLMAEAEWCHVTTGWFLLLVLIDHSPVAATVLLGVFTAGSVVQLVAVGRRDEIADLVVASTIMVGCELAVLAVAMAVRRIAATAAAAMAREARARTEEVIAEQLHADRRRRYSDIAATTVPLLTDLTNGTADLADPAVRTTYAVAAARLRRQFAEHDEVVDPLLHELRACLDLAERKGVVVYLGTSGEHPPVPLAVRRALTEPALHAVTTATAHARVTVLGSADGVTVSVLTDGPPPLDPLPDNEVDVTVTRLVEEDRIWLEATWRCAVPRPSESL